MDQVIEKTQRVIDQVQVVKRGLMQELLTHGVPGRHTQFKRTVVGEIPEEWLVSSLESVSLRVTDGTHQSPPFAPNGVPFLLVKSISGGKVEWSHSRFVSDETYRELTRHVRAELGDILYTAVGATYGVSVKVDFNTPFTFQRHIALIKPDRTRIDAGFLNHFLNSPVGKKQADRAAVGNAQPTVTLAALAAFRVPVPSLDEQRDIADALDAIQARSIEEEGTRQRLNDIKRALMASRRARMRAPRRFRAGWGERRGGTRRSVPKKAWWRH